MMASLVTSILEGYRFMMEDLADPRTKDYFLMSSPWPVLSLLIGYNYFIHKAGPRFMADREPYQLNTLITIYNAVQVVASAYLLRECFRLAWGGEYNWLCQPMDWSDTPHNQEITRTVWLYFMVKLVDLLDTVFFVLRKKNKQVTFLHVYHHTGMAVLGWAGTKWMPSGHDTFIGLLNCTVHIMMYSYYLVTALWPHHKQHIWWKRHITELQMVQFLLIILHSLVLLMQPSCTYPKFTVFVFVPQNLFMFVLFYDFYRKTYINQRLDHNTDKSH